MGWGVVVVQSLLDGLHLRFHHHFLFIFVHTPSLSLFDIIRGSFAMNPIALFLPWTSLPYAYYPNFMTSFVEYSIQRTYGILRFYDVYGVEPKDYILTGIASGES